MQATAPDVAHYSARNGLIPFASALDAQEAMEELQDWLAEAHQSAPIALIGSTIRIGHDPARLSSGDDRGSGYGRHSDD